MPTVSIPSPPPIDGAQALPSLRTLGTGNLQAMPGDYALVGDYGFQPSLSPALVYTVYARSTGNDATGDGSIGAPYLTAERAWQDARTLPKGYILRIDMSSYGANYVPPTGSSPYVGSTLPPIIGNYPHYSVREGTESGHFGVFYHADIELYAAPTLVEAHLQGAWSAATTVASGAAGLSTITVAGAGWTVNEHVGNFLTLHHKTTGDGTNGPVAIISNTADTLYVAMPYAYLSFYVASYDIKIQAQSCTVDLSGADHWINGNGSFSITVAGFKFINTAYTALDSGLHLNRLNVIGCTDVGIYYNWCDEVLLSGTSVVNYLDINTGLCDLTNCTVIDADQVCAPQSGGSMGLFGCYVSGGDSIGEGNYHGYSRRAGMPRYVSAFYTVHVNTGRGGIRMLGKNQSCTFGFVHFDACGFGGVRLEWGAVGYMNGPISGTGNGAGVGGSAVYVLDDSRLQIATTTEASVVLDASNCTITGTVGGSDITIGNNPGVTWAQFFARQNVGDLSRTNARMFQRSATMKPLPPLTVTAVKTSTYTAENNELVRYTTAGGAFAVNLPVAATGSIIAIKNQGASANTLTVTPNGADTIDGAATYPISSGYGTITLYSDGVSDWMVVDDAGLAPTLSVDRKANASDTLLTTTGATSVVTYTPATQGNYLLHIYYRVVTATTNLTLTVSWTDGSGAQTQTILSVVPQAVGSYAIAPTFINSTAAAITLTATAGTANQIYVSANIMSV